MIAMTLVVPAGYGLVIHQFNFTGDPEPMAVTYGIANAALGGTPNQMAQQAHEAFDGVVVSLNPIVQLTGTEVQFQDAAPPAPPEIGVYSNTVVGGNPQGAIPQNTAYLVHKRTALGGRSGRGRFYLPGVGESVIDGTGVLDPATKAVFQTRLTQFLTDLEASPNIAGMVLFHDSLGAGAALPPTPVTSLVIDNRCATQRRRLRP